MSFKYVYMVSYYTGCPCHDGTNEPYLKFSNDLETILNSALEEMNEYHYISVYSFDGKEIGQFVRIFGFHTITSLEFRLAEEGRLYRVVDDGNGNQRWEDPDGNIIERKTK